MYAIVLTFILFFYTPMLLSKPTLRIYTYNSFATAWGLGPIVKERFESKYDCTIEYVALENSISLLNRVKIEGKSSQADIVIGLDSALIQSAKKTHLFTRNDIDISQLNIPGGWKDNTFIPFDYSYFAFVYDKNSLKKPPRSLRELVDSREEWKIIYQDPRLSAPGLGLIIWMQAVYGKDVKRAWKNIARKTITVTRDWGSAYNLFLRGESDLVLSYTTSPLYHLLHEERKSYVAAIFSEGHYLQVETAARLASSSHPKLAELFIRFLISSKVQSNVLTKNWMYPVIQISMPTRSEEATIPDLSLHIAPEEIEANRLRWIDLWLSTITQ